MRLLSVFRYHRDDSHLQSMRTLECRVSVSCWKPRGQGILAHNPTQPLVFIFVHRAFLLALQTIFISKESVSPMVCPMEWGPQISRGEVQPAGRDTHENDNSSLAVHGFLGYKGPKVSPQMLKCFVLISGSLTSRSRVLNFSTERHFRVKLAFQPRPPA